MERLELAAAATVLNSFAFDFLTRQRTAGTDLSWTMLSRVAVPSISECRDVLPITTASAGGGEAPKRNEDYFEVVWQANRAVAKAYGLDPDDLAHILSTFRVFARKRPEFHAFLQTKLADWR